VGHGIFGLVDGLLCGVLAVSAAEPRTDVATAVQAAARALRLSRNRLCITVSRMVDDIDTLPRAMTEARETLRLGQDLGVAGPALGVRTLALERLLAGHGDVDALRAFVDDQIGALERSDAAKGGQLMRTLEVLIECGGAKAEAAKLLHIRRQSLYYRLDQIARPVDDARGRRRGPTDAQRGAVTLSASSHCGTRNAACRGPECLLGGEMRRGSWQDVARLCAYAQGRFTVLCGSLLAPSV
jgi:hypothetical protein